MPIKPPVATGAKDYCFLDYTDWTAAYYHGQWKYGDKVAIYFDPEECGFSENYPFQLTDVEFALYDFAAMGACSLRFSVEVMCPDICDGPGIEIWKSRTYNITTFYPDIVTIYFEDTVCLDKPFFFNVEYLQGPQGMVPSLLFDEQVVDTCYQWVWTGQPAWWEWYDFWYPYEPPGWVLLGISGYCGDEQTDCGWWYWKPDTTEAPSGMPDFDQNQPGWSCYCGPTAVANCLWWFNAVPPGWTPPQLIDTLARYFHTSPVWGTYVDTMQMGLDEYFADYGFALTETTYWMPDFYEMEDSLKVCQDIILLLGFWWYEEEWQEFIRGDVNEDGLVNVADYAACLNGPPFSCDDAADVNDDGVLDNLDCDYLYNYLYLMGPPPPPPFPDCGLDPTTDALGCADYPECPGGGGGWYREGGHFVTMAGVNSEKKEIAISDPDRDQCVQYPWWPGRVRTADHLPWGAYGPTYHNNTQYVSHDVYISLLYPEFPSPGSEVWDLADYCYEAYKYANMNVPERFEAFTKEAPKHYEYWHVEVDAAVMICPKEVPNHPPEIGQPDFLEGYVDSLVEYDITGTDPDGDVILDEASIDIQPGCGNYSIGRISGHGSDSGTWRVTWYTDGCTPCDTHMVIHDLTDEHGLVGYCTTWVHLSEKPSDSLWYWKPDTTNAPSGMPDFDQNQGAWSCYCGPTAVANCLWWYGAVPTGWTPPQLIDTLARYFHTSPVWGTYVDTMQMGLEQYFQDYGFAFKESTFKMPDFYEMEDSLKVCQDIILLLGFWWYDEGSGIWYREGGHYVTMAGVCSESLKIAISDPDRDAAVGGWPGRVRPPSHPPAGTYPPTLHNNPLYVSHDMYQSILDNPFPSPGNPWWEIDYPWSWPKGKFSGINVPEEFRAVTKPAPEGGKQILATEVDYAVMICPKRENNPPEIIQPDTLYGYKVCDTVIYTFDGIDPDGDPILDDASLVIEPSCGTYSVTRLTGHGTSQGTWEVTWETAGCEDSIYYKIIVDLTDNQGNTSWCTTYCHLAENHPPTIDQPDSLEGYVDDVVQYTITGADPDSDVIVDQASINIIPSCGVYSITRTSGHGGASGTWQITWQTDGCTACQTYLVIHDLTDGCDTSYCTTLVHLSSERECDELDPKECDTLWVECGDMLVPPGGGLVTVDLTIAYDESLMAIVVPLSYEGSPECCDSMPESENTVAKVFAGSVVPGTWLKFVNIDPLAKKVVVAAVALTPPSDCLVPGKGHLGTLTLFGDSCCTIQLDTTFYPPTNNVGFVDCHDPTMTLFYPVCRIDTCHIDREQVGWHWKDSYEDYAPNGMPDIDQKQDNWMKEDQFTFCGPCAVANCFKWFDSKYNVPPGFPGDGIDMFPLVRDYLDNNPPRVGFDDHDPWNVNHTATGWNPGIGSPPSTPQPFVPGPQTPNQVPSWGELVERLAWYFDTDGIQSGYCNHTGTNVMDMQAGIQDWLESEHFHGAEQMFVRGDVNEDGSVDNADVIACQSGGPFSCDDAADVNDDGALDMTDCVYLVNYLYGGPAPPSPFPDCGVDLTPDALGCADFPPCPFSNTLADTLCWGDSTRPTFAYVESLVEKCEDVILLLGFWFEDPPGSGEWWRVGGHYVTVAGVNSEQFKIAFSDPFIDAAELGFPGRVGDGSIISHPHGQHHDTVHNDEGNVSHDIYFVSEEPVSPGGVWWLPDYAEWWDPAMINNFFAQNVPEEFVPMTAPWSEMSPIYTEVEYCVHISPWDYRGDINIPYGDGVVDIGDVVFLINYLYKGGNPPVPFIEGDVNCDGVIDLGDIVFLINYLFKNGDVPRCCDP